MSINDITLPDAAIASLYRSSLVRLNEASPTSEKTLPERTLTRPVTFLGGNRKNILVFVHYDDTDYLPEGQLAFLSSILKACQLTLEDIAIINLGKTPQSMDHFIETMKPAAMLVFGQQGPVFTPTRFNHFVVVYVNGISVLNAPALESFDPQNADSKANKSQLWNGLKLVFNL